MTAFGGESCVYDNMGNPAIYRGKTAAWKGRQLTSFNGNTFNYDGRGRRTSKNGIAYIYDSCGRVIKQSNGLEFYYDFEGIAACRYNDQLYLYITDGQGNVIALIDTNGNEVVQYRYDAWGNHAVVDGNGNEISSATHIGNLNPFRYRGYYYDTETGLYFLQTRYYDPEVGRFLNRDSVNYADPQTINGLNLYTYCLNNPIKYVDPSGHFVISAIFALAILGVAIGATVGGVFAHNIAKDAGVQGAALAGYTILGILGGGVAGAALGASVGYLIGGTAIGGALAIAVDGTVSAGYAAAKIALLGLGYLFAKWVPGSWPGDDPTVPPGDDFEWRGNGPIGSDKGAWYNPFTKDSLHPDLNHPAGIPPHWDWVNILKIIVRIFKI